MNEKYTYCYNYSGTLCRTTPENLEKGYSGKRYCPGLGWIIEGGNAFDMTSDWIDGELNAEEAKQYIRDHFHEEPVNFDGDPVSYEEWKKNKAKQDILNKMKGKAA